MMLSTANAIAKHTGAYQKSYPIAREKNFAKVTASLEFVPTESRIYRTKSGIPQQLRVLLTIPLTLPKARAEPRALSRGATVVRESTNSPTSAARFPSG